MTTKINFKKVFLIFFGALGLFAMAGIFMGAWGSVADSRLLERLFTDPLAAFRNMGYVFLLAFHGILALWVYVDCQNRGGKKRLWPVCTFITGIIGWLVYMIGRSDATDRKEHISCQS